MKNYAGCDNVDDAIAAELEAAGIEVHRSDFLKDISRSEVKTSIVGSLHGWHFKRAWVYWTAAGPGLPLEYATPLHTAHGKTVRVAGHCGCPSPLEWYKGFAVGDYHIDDAAGLKALADALKQCASDALVGA